MRFMKEDATHYSGTAAALDKGLSSHRHAYSCWRERQAGHGSKLALHHAFLLERKLRCEIQTKIVQQNQNSMNGVAVEQYSVTVKQLPSGKFLYSSALLLLRFHLIKFNIAVSPVLQVFPNFETVYRYCDRLAGRMFPK